MINKLRRDAGERKNSFRASKQKDSPSASPIRKLPAARDVLTPRERAVLAQIGRGASSKEVGERLGVSSRTIEFHRANIMRKLGVKKIVDLMMLALKETEVR